MLTRGMGGLREERPQARGTTEKVWPLPADESIGITGTGRTPPPAVETRSIQSRLLSRVAAWWESRGAGAAGPSRDSAGERLAR